LARRGNDARGSGPVHTVIMHNLLTSHPMMTNTGGDMANAAQTKPAATQAAG
jgi:hypothetical protein